MIPYSVKSGHLSGFFVMKSSATKYANVVIVLALTFLLFSDARGDVRILQSNSHGLTVEYLPETALPVKVVASEVQLSLKNGTTTVNSEGMLIPTRVVTVAVPPRSNPSVSLNSYSSGESWSGTLEKIGDGYLNDESAQISVSSTLTDNTIGQLEARTIGGVKVIRIPIYPVKHNSAQPRVELAERIEFKVQFNTSGSVTNSGTHHLNRLAELVILNKDQAKQWGRAEIADYSDPTWAQGYIYKIAVEREGIYRLTYEEMARSGVEISSGMPSDRIKLYGNGGNELSLNPDDDVQLGIEECAIFVEDNGDGKFDPGDWILFYGRGAGGWVPDSERGYRYATHHFSRNNIYWLNVDPAGGGKRMDGFNEDIAADFETDAARIRFYHEPDVFIYHREGFIGTGVQWYGHTFDGYSQLPQSVPVLSPLMDQSAEMRVRIVNGDGQGHIIVSLNRNPIGEFNPQGSGYIGVTALTEINEHLIDGINTVTFEQTNENAKVLYDWMELSYIGTLDRPRTFESYESTGNVKYNIGLNSAWLFDISDHNNVSIERGQSFTVHQSRSDRNRYMAITPSQFQSVSSGIVEYFPEEQDVNDLWSSATRADIVLITPDGYWDEMEPMLDFYRNREEPLVPVRVRLSEIYNRFGGGLETPVAIRNMLMYASEIWNDSSRSGSLDYVMFCGDGDYNYRHIGRTPKDNFLPPYEYNLYSSDDWFVDFSTSGGIATVLPEMITGRLTATSSYELRSMIDKIISYVEEPNFGTWRNRGTLVADDENGESFSREYQHVEFSEQLSNNYLPASMDKVKVFLTEYRSQLGRDKPQATEDLVEAINRGTLFVNYVGHGNPALWAHEHVFVQSRDMPRLDNAGRLPLFLAFTCDWAYWDDPSVQSFPEQLLAVPNRGAIGAIASTRLTYSGSNANLAREFYGRIFGGERLTIGEALASAKYGAVNPYSPTYHLLGDPTIYLATPRFSGRFTTLPQPMVPLAVSSVAGDVYGLNGQIDPAFSGEVEFLALDTHVPRRYVIVWYDSQGNERQIVLNYKLSGPTVYRGLFSVNDGRFGGQFVVPRDITLGGQAGRVVAYFHNDEIDGVLAQDSIAYADQVAAVSDNEPPKIGIFFDHRGFRPDDPVSSNPLLIVDLSDSSGINLTGAMGHGVRMSIDGGQQVDLTPFFRNNLDDYRSGSLERRIGPLDAGIHNIEIEAWDSFNNIDIASIDVDVVASNDGLSVYNVLNWPNPFNDRTNLTFLVNGEGDFELLVYTVGGTLVRDFRGTAVQGYNGVEWDGKDRAGRSIANGVYLYKVKVRDFRGNEAEGLGRIAYIR